MTEKNTNNSNVVEFTKAINVFDRKSKDIINFYILAYWIFKALKLMWHIVILFLKHTIRVTQFILHRMKFLYPCAPFLHLFQKRIIFEKVDKKSSNLELKKTKIANMLYISDFLLYQNLCCSEQSNGLLDTVSKKSFDYWGFYFCCVSIFFNFYNFKCS